MSFAEWFRSDPRSRALDAIAAIAARYRDLAANLERHSQASTYPTIRTALQRLSAEKIEQAEELGRFLATEGCKLPTPSPMSLDGASNWLRLKADLALEAESMRDLNQAIARLEGGEHRPAKWLRDFAANEERCLGELRDVVLRCDTYALD